MKEKKNDNELTFLQFFCKRWIWIMIIGLMPTVYRYIKLRVFELDTFIESVLVVFAMGFCIWRVSKIKL